MFHHVHYHILALARGKQFQRWYLSNLPPFFLGSDGSSLPLTFLWSAYADGPGWMGRGRRVQCTKRKLLHNMKSARSKGEEGFFRGVLIEEVYPSVLMTL